jgi:hypothetical protein
MKKKLKNIELSNAEMKIETSILKFHEKKIALENLAKALSEKYALEQTKSDKSKIPVKNNK